MRPRTHPRSTALLPATLVLAAGAAWLLARGDEPRPAPRGAAPRLVVLTPAEGLGALAAGFGDAWLDDRARGRVLRLDGETGRVRARIPVRGRVALAAGAGAVWALQSNGGYGLGLRGPLLRIDPRTNRVSARTPLRVPGGPRVLGFGLVARGRDVWVWGPGELLRVDGRSARVTQRIAVAADWGELRGLAPLGRELLAATADGHLLRFDERSGRRRGVARLGLAPPALRTAARQRLVLSADGTIAAADPASGRLAWRRRLGFRVGGAVRAHGLLWVHSAARDQPGDRVSALDPRTGRVLATGLIPAFGATGIASVGERVWVATAGGRVVVLPPPTPI